MTSVASRGTTDRITARILFKVLRAGSGIFAMYSSVFLGTALPFFIREILQAPSFLVYAQDAMRPYGAGVRASASGIGACAQLHHPESAAGPALRDRQHDEREWIPVRPERGPFVPRRDGARNAHHKAEEAAHQRVSQRPVGREPRHDVAAQDSIDGAIGRRQQ